MGAIKSGPRALLHDERMTPQVWACEATPERAASPCTDRTQVGAQALAQSK